LPAQVPARAQERARVPALEEEEAVVVVVVAEVVQESALECA
jgi:hypothetical protein